MTDTGAGTMLDHIAIYCSAAHFESEVTFLNGALASLGIKEQFRPMNLLSAIGTAPGSTPFWLAGMTQDGPIEGPVTRTHIAFKAKDKEQVHAFHSAALEAGGKDYGAPGYREHFGPGYYAAFIISPAGHNVEVIFRDPERIQQGGWLQLDAVKTTFFVKVGNVAAAPQRIAGKEVSNLNLHYEIREE